MKIVAAAQELIYMQSELSIVSKTMVVGNRILDKLLILDRKHRIKDKVVSFVQFCYEKATSAINEAQSNAQEKDSEERNRRLNSQDINREREERYVSDQGQEDRYVSNQRSDERNEQRIKDEDNYVSNQRSNKEFHQKFPSDTYHR